MQTVPGNSSFPIPFSPTRGNDLKVRKAVVEAEAKLNRLRDKMRTLTVSEVLKREFLPAKESFPALSGLDILKELEALDNATDLSQKGNPPYHPFRDFLNNNFADTEIPKIKRGCHELERVGLILPIQRHHVGTREASPNSPPVTIGYALSDLGRLALQEFQPTIAH